eukprot:c18004_g1_i1.p1 GENE.c18004_g1_i1~~c18004_g1_i1.p1  ORF type:complete len:506 (+),score=53.68 c18004_g1_i1:30-1520(+)
MDDVLHFSQRSLSQHTRPIKFVSASGPACIVTARLLASLTPQALLEESSGDVTVLPALHPCDDHAKFSQLLKISAHPNATSLAAMYASQGKVVGLFNRSLAVRYAIRHTLDLAKNCLVIAVVSETLLVAILREAQILSVPMENSLAAAIVDYSSDPKTLLKPIQPQLAMPDLLARPVQCSVPQAITDDSVSEYFNQLRIASQHISSQPIPYSESDTSLAQVISSVATSLSSGDASLYFLSGGNDGVRVERGSYLVIIRQSRCCELRSCRSSSAMRIFYRQVWVVHEDCNCVSVGSDAAALLLVMRNSALQNLHWPEYHHQSLATFGTQRLDSNLVTSDEYNLIPPSLWKSIFGDTQTPSPQWQAQRDSTGLPFGLFIVRTRSDHTLVGVALVQLTDRQEVGIRFAIDEQHRRRHYATEMVGGIVAHMRAEVNTAMCSAPPRFHRDHPLLINGFTALVPSHDPIAARVLSACGFECCRILSAEPPASTVLVHRAWLF